MPVPIPPPVLAMSQQNQFPAALLDQFGAMAFLTVGAAQRLGVFDALGDDGGTASELAARLDLDAGATGRLLDALVAYDYVERAGAVYRPGGQARVWLRDGGHEGFADVVAFWSDALTALWTDLPEAVRSGRPAHDFYGWLAEDDRRLRGFGRMQDQAAADLAGPVADLVVPLAQVRTGARVLDVGGGLGRVAEAFCERLPDAQAKVVELAETASLGRERVERAGLSERIAFETCDVRTDALPDAQDVVILANVLHTFAPAVAADLVRRAAAALAPTGLLVVIEHLADLLDAADPIRRAQGRGFDLHLLQTQAGRLPTSDELSGWITAAGLAVPDHHEVPEFPINHILIARASSDGGRA